jgi:hypothetical protein
VSKREPGSRGDQPLIAIVTIAILTILGTGLKPAYKRAATKLGAAMSQKTVSANPKTTTRNPRTGTQIPLNMN